MKIIIALAIAAAFALCAVRTADARTGPRACTRAELRVLQIRIPRELQIRVTWDDSGAVPLDVTFRQVENLAAACRRVPGRWSYVGNDFLRSTRLIDRLYPGSWLGAWERACAPSEGGYGRWVPNGTGSGAGGWLQFMSGTFYGIIDDAFAHARARGVRPPRWAWSWHSPLGHALAGAEMILHGRRSEWTGATC